MSDKIVVMVDQVLHITISDTSPTSHISYSEKRKTKLRVLKKSKQRLLLRHLLGKCFFKKQFSQDHSILSSVSWPGFTLQLSLTYDKKIFALLNINFDIFWLFLMNFPAELRAAEIDGILILNLILLYWLFMR